jgi:hypothetical protein
VKFGVFILLKLFIFYFSYPIGLHVYLLQIQMYYFKDRTKKMVFFISLNTCNDIFFFKVVDQVEVFYSLS